MPCVSEQTKGIKVSPVFRGPLPDMALVLRVGVHPRTHSEKNGSPHARPVHAGCICASGYREYKVNAQDPRRDHSCLAPTHGSFQKYKLRENQSQEVDGERHGQEHTARLIAFIPAQSKPCAGNSDSSAQQQPPSSGNTRAYGDSDRNTLGDGASLLCVDIVLYDCLSSGTCSLSAEESPPHQL